MKEAQNYLARINPDRMRDTLWRLVSIPSPTGREREAAAAFADLLSQAGADVQIDSTLPNSPSVIGRLRGDRPGPVLQLAGHLDHIDIPHEAPKKESDRISGRGSADMKNGLTGIVEIIHILHESGCRFPGQILVTAYGLHEAPQGDSAGLNHLLRQGVKGQAALVFEGPCDGAAVMANGMAIWNLTLCHKEPPCHELCTQRETFELMEAAANTIEALAVKNQQLKKQPKPYPLLPPESVFVGQMHCGDFYNRLSASCFMQGTRRWNPGKTFSTIQEDFRLLLKSLSLPPVISAECSWMLVGDSYALDGEEKIVQCLRQAFEDLHQKPLPLKGHSSVTDVCRLVNSGKIPAVLWGFGTDTGHADYEYVAYEQLVRSCRVALLTVLYYLHRS